MYSGQFAGYFTPEVVDLHAEAAVRDLLNFGMPLPVLLDGLRLEGVTVSGEPVTHDEGCPELGGCNGTVLGNGVKVRAFPCEFNTALRHEMTHHLECYVTGEYDYGHTRPYWKTADEPVGVCL